MVSCHDKMMSMKRDIDFKNWPRTAHYQFFQDYELPRFNMTFSLDVGKFYSRIKASGLKFYFAFMHLIIKEMNQIENFRYRIEEDQVFDAPIEFVSFTDMVEATKLFKMVFTRFHQDVYEFQTEALKASALQGSQLIQLESEAVRNTVYVTSFPWGQFTHFTHATKLGPKDSVPRISWSQFVDHGDQKIINVSIEAHHGLVDGYHVGLLLNRLKVKLL
jgi:chloramphenicol O-acetyltransferase type A